MTREDEGPGLGPGLGTGSIGYRAPDPALHFTAGGLKSGCFGENARFLEVRSYPLRRIGRPHRASRSVPPLSIDTVSPASLDKLHTASHRGCESYGCGCRGCRVSVSHPSYEAVASAVASELRVGQQDAGGLHRHRPGQLPRDAAVPRLCTIRERDDLRADLSKILRPSAIPKESPSHSIQCVGRDPATGPTPNWSGPITGGRNDGASK